MKKCSARSPCTLHLATRSPHGLAPVSGADRPGLTPAGKASLVYACEPLRGVCVSGTGEHAKQKRSVEGVYSAIPDHHHCL